jgi:CBS domain containing-hemolysin-like protein
MAELLVVIVIALLIAINGIFVAAEFAVVAAPRGPVARHARAGERWARRLRRILEEPLRQDRFIATAQLGITLASLGLGMYGEHALAGWIYAGLVAAGAGSWAVAHGLATVLAVGVLTYLHIVVGEMVPKALALQHPVGTARGVLVPMEIVRYALYPLVVGLNAAGNGILRLFGVRREVVASERFHTSEELELIVDESARGGQLESQAGQIVRELFDLAELTAGEIMVPRVRLVGLPLGASAGELAERISRSPHTRYPVYDGSLDRIVGVAHAKDLLRRLRSGEPLAEIDVRALPQIPESMTLDEVLEVMSEARSQMAVVLDEFGGTAGILGSQDLAEELVGVIDEGGDAPAEIERRGQHWSVAGTARLDELGEVLGRPLEHPDVVTVSGLVLHELGSVPRAGDLVRHAGVEIAVESVFGSGVERATVRTVSAVNV